MKFYNPKRLVLFTAHIVLSVLISLLAVGQTASVTPKPVKTNPNDHCATRADFSRFG